MPRKDGWEGLASGLLVMEAAVSRQIGGKMQGAL